MNTVFITLSLIAAAFFSCEPTSEPTPKPSTPETFDVYGYTSTASRSMTFNESGVNFFTGGNMSPNTIRIYPDVKYQTIDGFGAALTGASCYNLLRMPPADRSAFMKEIFDTVDGLGLSYVRVSIGCSDFSLSEYTCCDRQGIENFALTSEELNYVIPILKEALAYNPNIKVLGSPWTAPRWMKVSEKGGSAPYNSWTGGHLNTAYYQDYATYFVKWIRAFEAQCVPVYAITIQNEPLNSGNSASMLMEWDEQRDFIKNALGPKLQQAGLHTKVFVFDHNYNYDDISSQNDYPIHIYNDGDAEQYVAGAAYHHYGGTRAELSDIHNQRPGKDLIFSEGSIGTWNSGRDLENNFTREVEEGIDLVAKWCKAVIVWNLMLDMNGAPNRPGGCTTCFGAVDIASDYKSITRNTHYYEIGHLSKVVKAGAVCIKADGYSPSGLVYQAFRNPDGSHALVVLNKSNAEITFVAEDDTHSFSYSLQPKAAVSLRW
ncbi:MAG: glucosylceramidase [Bacteroidales bacterium]|nr:glucosylceramidase [Bacteroidales bacterium]